MRYRRLMAIGLAALVLAGTLFVLTRRPEVLYASHARPDGRYKVDVYRRPSRWGLMPGQSGDVPGRAVLRDNHDKILGEVELEMVQLGDAIEWQPGSVSIRAIVDWPLPEPETSSQAGAWDASPSPNTPSR